MSSFPDVRITPRDRRFGRDAPQPRWWNGGDPFATALYNALSATFPKGETLFIDSVRRFRDRLPPPLAEDARAFILQEVAHSREHLAFNRRASASGYDLSKLEKAVDDRLALLSAQPPIVSLAVTIALEHFTAILAHELLKHDAHLARVDVETAALWRWHAVEEIEHKGVAFDCWRHATRDWPALKRWLVRTRIFLLVSRNFLADRTAGALELLRQDGLTGPRAWLRLFWFAWGRPGMMRKVGLPWARYLLPGFHPWQQDDRKLIEGALTRS